MSVMTLTPRIEIHPAMTESVIVIVLLAAVTAERWRQERHIHIRAGHVAARKVRSFLRPPVEGTPDNPDGEG